MDTVTQMLLGGTVGQFGFRRRLGRRAVVAGALFGLVPDLDIAVKWVAGDIPYWEHHRGLTHSVFFGPIVGPVAGVLVARVEARRRDDTDAMRAERRRAWMGLGVAGLLTHPLIDLFTSYGTMMLSPFSDARLAIDALPVIDPIYSLALAVALLIGVFVRPGRAEIAAALALLFVSGWTLMGWAVNERLREAGRAAAPFAGEVTAYPLLLQPWYRRILVMGGAEAAVGYASVLNPQPIAWTRLPLGRTPAIDAVRATHEGRVFDWFAMGKVQWTEMTGAEGARRVTGYDLRYGMPGAEPSFWGLAAEVGPDGTLAAPPAPISVPRPTDSAAFRAYWRAVTGW